MTISPAIPCALPLAAFRAGKVAPTSGIALGHTQANLISLPREHAYDMLLFARRNPKPCPLLEVTEPGSWENADLDKPDFGDAVTIAEGDVPMFWACGVTSQAAVVSAKPPFAITHEPGHMFVTDARDTDYRVA